MGVHREDRDVQPGAAGWAVVNRGPASSVEPFTIDVSAEVLADLRQRLERTRWPDVSPRGGWVSGTDQALLGWLVGYWLREFDWSARQAELNAFAQFRASVDGLGLHFVHQRGGEAVPLLVLHGWPSMFAQMTRLVPGGVGVRRGGALAARVRVFRPAHHPRVELGCDGPGAAPVDGRGVGLSAVRRAGQ